MREGDELRELSVLVRGTASLYTQGSVIWPRFGAFDIWVHEFRRIMYIRYVTLGCYHTRWWYWSKKR